MDFFAFLERKLKGYSPLLLIRLELESLLFGIFSFIPTSLGILLRAGVAKLLFKSMKGFCWIQPRVIIVHAERITLGHHFGVNSGTYINGIGEIEIGNHVLIGSNVTISSGKHPIDGEQPSIFERQSIPQKIIIEDDVWIGAGAVIMPGITLRKGTVIGANAVVTRDTEPYSVYAGAPAKFLRRR